MTAIPQSSLSPALSVLPVSLSSGPLPSPPAVSRCYATSSFPLARARAIFRLPRRTRARRHRKRRQSRAIRSCADARCKPVVTRIRPASAYSPSVYLVLLRSVRSLDGVDPKIKKTTFSCAFSHGTGFGDSDFDRLPRYRIFILFLSVDIARAQRGHICILHGSCAAQRTRARGVELCNFFLLFSPVSPLAAKIAGVQRAAKRRKTQVRISE